MKHIDKYSTTPWYDPKPETVKARAALDKILKGTSFTSKTKALWAYYRGNESVSKIHTARELYTLNLSFNGALNYRLHPLRTHRFEKSIRPTTIARWQYAMTLIDIAKAKHGWKALIQRINDLITGEVAEGETLHGSKVTLHIDLSNQLVLSVTEEAAEPRTWVIIGPKRIMS